MTNYQKSNYPPQLQRITGIKLKNKMSICVINPLSKMPTCTDCVYNNK